MIKEYKIDYEDLFRKDIFGENLSKMGCINQCLLQYTQEIYEIYEYGKNCKIVYNKIELEDDGEIITIIFDFCNLRESRKQKLERLR